MDWYLSFSGETQFNGAVVVPDVNDIVEAFAKVHAAGINPGGEVFGIPIETERMTPEERRKSDALPRMRLLSLDDLKAADMDPVGLDGRPA